MGTPARVRIAPSPTGDPHVGTAYVALFNWALAQWSGGQFILRIDDTDRTRYRADSEAAIMRSLGWLGLSWDEGPDVGGPHAPYRQSERRTIYDQKITQLLDSGAAYRCFCTAERLDEMRARQRAEKRSGGYDRHCRNLSAQEAKALLDAGTDYVVRLAMPLDGETCFEDGLRGTVSVPNREVDDQVLVKSDGFPTYHFANVVDDIAFGITHVIRAEEWITSTPKHVQLYAGFGEPLPRFYHVPLLRNADKSKISKRKNPVSLDFYREKGYLPEALLNFLANMGWASPTGEEVFDLEHFREHFRIDDLSLGGPVFDLVKLDWMNGVYIRALPPEELLRRLEDEGFLPDGVDPEGALRILPLVTERLTVLSDFAEKTGWFFGEPDAASKEDFVPKKMDVEGVRTALAALRERLRELEDWSLEAIEGAVEEVRERLELKKPQIFMPARIALTGRKDSPSVFELIEVLGRDRVDARLDSALEQLGA